MKRAAQKVRSFAEIERIVRAAKRAGRRIVTTNGCFDILHIGHIKNLEEAKSLGDILIVGINSDASVRRNKGKDRPINPERERAEVIAALENVDYAFIFTTDGSSPWLEKLKPQVHAKGSDRKLSEIPERETVERNGGSVKLLRLVRHRSTTALIEKAARSLE